MASPGNSSPSDTGSDDLRQQLIVSEHLRQAAERGRQAAERGRQAAERRARAAEHGRQAAEQKAKLTAQAFGLLALLIMLIGEYCMGFLLGFQPIAACFVVGMGAMVPWYLRRPRATWRRPACIMATVSAAVLIAPRLLLLVACLLLWLLLATFIGWQITAVWRA